MLNQFYLSLENITSKDRVALEDCIENLNFNDQGRVPVITQCNQSKDVLMHAWMNKSAVEKILLTGQMTYWSRSRNASWIKGETSGHTQELVSMRFDCDGDTVLCLVNQVGPACHTGRPNCFYLEADAEAKSVHEALFHFCVDGL